MGLEAREGTRNIVFFETPLRVSFLIDAFFIDLGGCIGYAGLAISERFS
jgi:hypothetical protein